MSPSFRMAFSVATGHDVIYTANSGSPIPAGQTYWDMNGRGNFTTDWQMTISADGKYTLTCHFPAPQQVARTGRGRGSSSSPAGS